MPPMRKIQMTDLAFGGTLAIGASAARTTPSRASMAPSARPVKPMPMSARKARRLFSTQRREEGKGTKEDEMWVGILSHRDKVIVIEQNVHQVLASALGG